MVPLETLIGLLAAVTALAWLAQRINIEYPILLIIGGLFLGFIPGLPVVTLQPEIVFLLFLPPLLYYESYNSSLRDWRANLRPIISLAVFLVIATIAAVAFVSHALIPTLPWAAAIVLGAIVGPTDETAAIAIAQRLRVPRQLITLIKAESLLNDGTSLVIYNVALGAAVVGTFSVAMGLWQLFIDSIGGIAIGLAVGWVLTIVRRRLTEPLIQNTASLLSGYIAYYPADALHVSGVLATIAAGIYLGRHGHTFTTPESRIQNTGMREVALFVVNGMLFILVGLQLHPILDSFRGSVRPGELLWLAFAISATVIVVRIVWVFLSAYVPRALFPSIRKRDPYPPWQVPLAASWAGMRGGVSLAAALAVPLVTAAGAPFPHRELIIFLTFAVILATLVGQGLTLPILIRLLGLRSGGDAEREETLARIKATRAAETQLKQIAKQRWADRAVVEDVSKHLKQQYTHYKGRSDEAFVEPEVERRDDVARRIEQQLNDARRDELLRLRDEGAINDAVRTKLERELDLEDLRREASATTQP